jgi:hypothetical protein
VTPTGIQPPLPNQLVFELEAMLRIVVLSMVVVLASAQYFGNGTSVEFCTHSNTACRPVTGGELFLAVAPFTLLPYVIAVVVLLVSWCQSSDRSIWPS